MAMDVDVNLQRQCVLHDLELLPLACKDCKVSVCSQCLVQEHFRHGLTEVSNVANEYRRLLEQALTDEETGNLTLLNQKIDQHSSDLNEHEKDVLMTLEKRADEIVEKVRENQKTNSEKAIVLAQKYRKGLDKVKLKTNMCLQVKNRIVASSQDGSKALPSLSDLDIVATFTDFKHLQNIRTVAAEGNEFPFIQNPISNETLQLCTCSFEKEVNENECLSDFVEDTNVEDDENGDIFHDCEVVPYCLEGERVISTHTSIDEIVPITQNIAYIRCGEDLYRVHKTGGQWKDSRIQSDVHQIVKVSNGEVFILKSVSGSYHLQKVLSDGRIETVNRTYLAGCCGKILQNSGACLLHIIHLDLGRYLDFYTLSSHGTLTFSFTVPREQSRYGDKRLQKAAIQQTGTILFLQSDGNITSISSPFWVDFLQNCGIIDRTSSFGKKIKTFSSGIVDMEVPTTESDVIVIDTKNNVKLLDKNTGNVKRILLSETNGLKCPISVTLDDFGTLWVGSKDGKIFFVPYRAL